MKLHRTVTPRQEVLSERALFNAVAVLRTADECRAFFRDLCTPAEIQAMADRWAAVDCLQRGLPYREIHRLTGVSVTTIGRVARFLDDRRRHQVSEDQPVVRRGLRGAAVNAG